MSLARLSTLTALALSALALAAGAQLTDVHFDADTPSVGPPTAVPFSTITVLGASGFTTVQRLPASSLVAAGLTAGAQLTEVALASPGTVTLNSNDFVCAIGSAATPWSSTQLIGNVIAPFTLYDSAIDGPMTFAVTGNAWSALPMSSPPVAVWDGVSDLALYLSTGIVTSSFVGPIGGPVLIATGTMRTASGTVQRNISTGFAATTATASDMDGLKVRLTFLEPVPPPGTVTVLNPTIAPGQGAAVFFDAPGYGGEFFVPIVSCTNVPGSLPGVLFPLPVTPDACTTFQFTSPLGSLMFTWGIPGSQFGLLDSMGQSIGIVNSIAGVVPPGLNLDLHITYLTLDGFAVTNVHGVDTLTLN